MYEVINMQNKIKQFNSQNNFETPLEKHIAKIIGREFRRLEESIASQYELLEAQSDRTDSHGDHLRYKFISPLALKMLDLLDSVTECAAEYDFVGLDEEA